MIVELIQSLDVERGLVNFCCEQVFGCLLNFLKKFSRKVGEKCG